MASGGSESLPLISSSTAGSTGDVPSTQTNSFLECRVCDNVYGVQGDKIPRLLFCGHSLCHTCLLRLPTAEKIIFCPFDRQPTSLGPNGVWDLKKNFALIELLERVSVSSKKPGSGGSILSPHISSSSNLSVCCDEDENHVAIVYCTICGSHLCEACSHSTHATRTLVKHRRIPIAEKPKEKLKCAYHSSHVMEFTCLEVDCQTAPLMCYICKDYGRHKGHQHGLLEVEAEKTRSTIQGAVKRLKKFMEEVTDANRKLEMAVQTIVSRSDLADDSGREADPIGTGELAKRRVRTYFQVLRDKLARQEVTALTVVDTYIRERLCSLRQQEEDMATILGQVAAVCVHCDRVSRLDDARVLLAAQEIRAMLTTVEGHQTQVEELNNAQFDSSIPITFTKDNRVHIGPKIEMRVVTLGLDGSGKTSILFKLKQNEFVPTIPTIGFNVETLEYRNIKFTVWDVGGQLKLRPLWRHYFVNTQAVMFVIDSSDKDRLDEAKNELMKLLGEKELKDACILILLSKQDLPDSMSLEEISDQFSLHKLCCGKSWHLQACDSRSGEGLAESLDWLSRQLVASGVSNLG